MTGRAKINYRITLRRGRRSKTWEGTASGWRATFLVSFGLAIRGLPQVDSTHNQPKDGS